MVLKFFLVMYMKIRKLRELRVINEISQKRMAEILNVTQQTYSNYEKSITEIPIDILIKFADYFEVSIDFILDRDTSNLKNKLRKN